ncbi:MAG: DNA translocase FtsK [Alphaproteobacteria bacterium]|nr:DNA translocase FtsK [Alphaproteobacteria bacterium]
MQGLVKKLPQVLAHFGISGTIGAQYQGPLITEVEFELSKGSKFSAVEKQIKDIARELGVSGIRVAEIPNSTYISFELPNEKLQSVPFLPLTEQTEFTDSQYDLPICVGVNMRGVPVMKNLAKMPHLLVAGTTGSGKSVGLNSFILSLIKKKTPQELKFVLIDPKRIEFSMYNNQAYMLRPVITEMSIASACLAELVAEMNARYAKFEKSMARNIGEYNAKNAIKMPYIVCVIDEFADLMLFDKTVEKQVQILAQKARASGIHLLIATQRPSVDVITGSVKANLPTRLSYKVASATDSMTILNTTGAENLLGRGDSLLLEENGTLTRILGAYVSDDDIMQTLEPYRCEIKEPQPTNVVVVSGDNNNITVQQTIKQEQQKPSIWARIADWWNRIGRRRQNQIINWILTLIFAAFQAKNASSKARSTTATMRKITSATKKTSSRRR